MNTKNFNVYNRRCKTENIKPFTVVRFLLRGLEKSYNIWLRMVDGKFLMFEKQSEKCLTKHKPFLLFIDFSVFIGSSLLLIGCGSPCFGKHYGF